MKLGELLNTKEFKYRKTVTAGPNETIFAAVAKLAEHDRGSLPVCDDKGELLGIITERDIVRKLLTRKDCSIEKTKVKEIMSTQVIIATPSDDLSYAINVMKEKRIRHIPVLEGRKVIGMISMRDLLGVELEECKLEARFLTSYISGSYPSATP